MNHLGLTVPHLLLIALPLSSGHLLKSVAVLTATKCLPIAVLAKDTYPKNQTVAVGLGLSLLGDFFLGLGHEYYFMHGLGSFFLAHIAYIKGIQETNPPFAPLSGLGLGLGSGLIVHRILLPHVPPKLKIPVVIYATALMGMAWRSLARFIKVRSALRSAVGDNHEKKIAPAALQHLTRAKWGVAGSFLFVCSDFLLSYNKFVSPIPWHDLWVMSTYYIAQIAITMSV